MRDDFGDWGMAESRSDPILILHVDDDIDFTEVAATLLERECEEFEVVSANSAESGLEIVQSQPLDCIVSDYDMPGENGLEFFASLPTDSDDLPFILFTGKGSEEIASEAFSVGVSDYLQKGYGTERFTVLANRIQSAVDQARARQVVEVTRRRFKTLVEESNDAIFVVDSEGTIRYATPAAEHILGKPPATLIDTNGFDPIHPDDVETASEEFATLIEDPNYQGTAEFRYRHADGSWLWLEVRGRNLLANDDILGIVVYARDIDDRKLNEQAIERSEKKFRAVFEGAFDAMVLADDDGVYMEANPAACELFGVDRDDLLGRTISEFAPTDYEFEANWRHFQESTADRGLFPLERPDGQQRMVEYSATPNILPHRHLSILRDVTERERLRRQNDTVV